MSACSVEDIKSISLIPDGEEKLEKAGLTSTHTQPAMMECWAVEAPQVQSRMLLPLLSAPREPRSHVTSYQAREVISWLGQVVLELEGLQRRDPPTSLQDLQARVKHLKEMQQEFVHYRSAVVVDAGGPRGAGDAVPRRGAGQQPAGGP
ncbi:hypothetical protein CRUP_024981 [Coryphaenoides rupestris]|nr:hypothetical protein CRUP_024981 [Coryphaenoides rupestris]